MENNNVQLEIPNISVPDNSNMLSELESRIDTLKYILESEEFVITNKLHETYYNEIASILFMIAELSKPCFSCRDDIENTYSKYYLSSPALGNKLWWEHYENIHKEYSTLKNRCFRLFEFIDTLYINKFKSYPPNWDI